MKKILSTIFAIALTVAITSCDNNDEPDDSMIWDLVPVEALIYVNNAIGDDLLSNETEGNLLGQTASLIFEGDTTHYVLKPMSYDSESRYFFAQFRGIEIFENVYQQHWCLHIGDWPGEDSGTYDMQLIIAGQTHSIKIINNYKWKNNKPQIKREHYLDGKPVDRIMTLVL